jgi:hypothetical protein
MLAKSVWESGAHGGALVGGEGQWRGSRGLGGALVGQEQRGGLLHNILVLI